MAATNKKLFEYSKDARDDWTWTNTEGSKAIFPDLSIKIEQELSDDMQIRSYSLIVEHWITKTTRGEESCYMRRLEVKRMIVVNLLQ